MNKKELNRLQEYAMNAPIERGTAEQCQRGYAELYRLLKSRAEIYDGHICFPDIKLSATASNCSPFDTIDCAIYAALQQKAPL